MIWKRGENILILIMEENHKDLRIIAGAVSFIYLQIPSLIHLILFIGGTSIRSRNLWEILSQNISSIGTAGLDLLTFLVKDMQWLIQRKILPIGLLSLWVF